MISVLICSANPMLLEQVSKNITATIGTAFEILHFDNREINKGICEVYNLLAEKAIYPYYCFVHEDVLFVNEGWGRNLLSHFAADPRVALIGIAGSKYKSSYFSGWYSSIQSLDCGNIVHRNGTTDARNYFSPTGDRQPQEVVCVDGVLMGCTKQAWQQHRFSDAIRGFHFYDLDFSLRVAQDAKVMVVYDIDLIHLTTGGDFGNRWVEGAFQFHKMHAKRLPFSVNGDMHSGLDTFIIRLWLDYLKNFQIHFSNKLLWISRQQLQTRPALYYSILKFLAYQPLRLKHLHSLLKKR